ncbi:hypothetical protein DFA_03275 [Cavenderia fasciculata]|uniref:Uncharacterized protein n=1 Tax=Cavenderia fasciculata TaxID=261658 RepID=F4PH45_CACFS|nr:uncharacterized protein DFA_03275 [Cavenderia fasciculata]EGG25029.1 hypothetical protein DFA_03275 [Cavenderia fasciculata]|eukprot:XP_004362880.1 hypothetical protein DFA_03275 [Cavenderia fasciculata]
MIGGVGGVNIANERNLEMEQIYFSTVIPKKHRATMVMKNESYKNADYMDMVAWLRKELKIEGKERIKNDLKSFLRSIPVGDYVKFTVSLEHDQSVISAMGSGMLGFVSEHVLDAFDTLDFNGIEIWKQTHMNHEPSTEELMKKFHLDHLHHVKIEHQVPSHPKHYHGTTIRDPIPKSSSTKKTGRTSSPSPSSKGKLVLSPQILGTKA